MLYIVSTPIGNLDDISIRQAMTLLGSDYILAEDTRSAQILLDACTSRFPNLALPSSCPKVISYYKEKEFEKLPYILTLLREDKTVSLVSDSGTPLINDPGFLLVKTVIKESLPFSVIPGPSAVITALVLSGFMKKKFLFLGFLPKKASELLQLINQLKYFNEQSKDIAFVGFESAQRINNTLKLLQKTIPDCEIALCREMTKKFEEVVRGSSDELLKRTYKGELTLVISLP